MMRKAFQPSGGRNNLHFGDNSQALMRSSHEHTSRVWIVYSSNPSEERRDEGFPLV